MQMPVLNALSIFVRAVALPLEALCNAGQEATRLGPGHSAQTVALSQVHPQGPEPLVGWPGSCCSCQGSPEQPGALSASDSPGV